MAHWTVSTYYKKSVEEHEIWTHPKHGTMRRKTGFRWGTFNVDTEDDNPPDFTFVEVPGGNGTKDSIDMYSCGFDSELDNLNDGCWEEYDFPDSMDEDEQERLQELIDEEGWYALEEGDDPWTLDDSECYFWGPIVIENDSGYHRIIVADADGNVTDFKE